MKPLDRADRAARVRIRLEESGQVKRALAESESDAIARAAEILAEAMAGGGRVLLFGNGGSAADAQHFAAELTGRYELERPGLPALALTANSSDLTALGNDYGFERVFARLIQAQGRPGDVAVAISTSGNSPNINAGVIEARERGLRTVALIGKGGGKLASLVDLAVTVPSDSTARVQEAHIAIIHVICELVEAVLFGAEAD